jgi:hypothetical protein
MLRRVWFLSGLFMTALPDAEPENPAIGNRDEHRTRTRFRAFIQRLQ